MWDCAGEVADFHEEVELVAVELEGLGGLEVDHILRMALDNYCTQLVADTLKVAVDNMVVDMAVVVVVAVVVDYGGVATGRIAR